MFPIKKLPDTEFEIMKIIWQNEPPITTSMIKEQLGDGKEWKAQTILTLLTRLVERGFLRTEKIGKERTYFPLIEKEEYLKIETHDFMKKFHGNSLSSFVSTLYDGKDLTENDLDELQSWLENRRG